MRLLWVILLLIVLPGTVLAQQSRSDRLYERGDYLGAMKLYQKELDNVGEGASEQGELLKARIANCLFRLNDVIRAGQAYKKVNQDLLGTEDLTFYAIALIRGGEYDQAAGLIDVVESLGGDAAIVERLRGSCEYAKEVVKEKPLYTANKMNVDFAGFSSGVTYYKGNGLILAAPGAGEDALKDTRGYKTTRLYNVVFSGTGGRMIPFADGLVDKYHIGALTFTKDFKRIYYTRTILKNDKNSILKLMTAEEVDGKWENIQELSVNSEDYSCAHPCLYKDSLLYFVSDMPGGTGGKDIYVTTVNGAECGEVRNLGETVNTIFDELFPFVAADGKLYFASNGHVGLGGLDVFVSEQGKDGNWSKPRNMGRPINSSMDDFALTFKDLRCEDGYVSSNRGGTGYNDFLFSLKLIHNRKAMKKELAKATESAQPESDTKSSVMAGGNSQDMTPFQVDYRYAIQIGAFRNPVPRVYFQEFQNVKVYLGFDNVYRYTVGEYPEENIAQADLSNVRHMIGDAFVLNVERYVAERKIQNNVRGDEIPDDELLLRRLKNFEREKKVPARTEVPARRFLNRPQESEVPLSNGYTIVLMVSDKIEDLKRFGDIGEIDVYVVTTGKYLYCSGFYPSPSDAMPRLQQFQQQGFPDARLITTGTYEYYSQSVPASPRNAASVSRSDTELKRILNF